MELTARRVPQRTAHSLFSQKSIHIFICRTSIYFILFFIYLDLIYNDVLVSDVQQSDSVTHSHIHVLFFNGSFNMIPFRFIYLFTYFMPAPEPGAERG